MSRNRFLQAILGVVIVIAVSIFQATTTFMPGTVPWVIADYIVVGVVGLAVGIIYDAT